ncbi:MAG TPA: phage tail sheath C-terminal domain-containing protein [Geminicoccaceae bacterium]|mgnify:CR=1 FL=1|nr:phage tail sheath C-terminal domain-containing protein [Geminicoccus sp.]HMU50442.1 phage tail sheath C-terminal domain-containing protein [Geminicoccaceae bacterium]
MPVKPTYPGVYIEEIPSGVRTITGVATSVAAFVDRFSRGPLDSPVQLFGMADFEREFGGLGLESEASYAVQQFFLNGGGECFVVRVANTVGPTTATTPAAEASRPLRVQPAAGATVLTLKAGRMVGDESVGDPGSWGNNLFVEVDYDTADPPNAFNLTVGEIVVQGGRRVTRRSESHRGLRRAASGPGNAIDTLNAASMLVQAAAGAGWPASLPAATGTMGAAINPATSIPATPVALTVDAGAGARTVSVPHALGASSSDHPAFRPLLEAAIRAAASAASSDDERALLEGATVRLVGKGTGTNGYRYHVLAGRGGSGFTGAETLATGGAGAAALGLDGSASVGPQQMKLDGGKDGLAPTAAQLAGVKLDKTGIYALEDVDLVNILCLPAAAGLSASEMRTLYMQAETYCEERRAFLIVDIPEAVDTLARMQTWIGQNDGLRHRNAAVYFPRTRIADPLDDGRPRSIGASGTIAGLYARTDATRGVWKAPAGTDARLRNVLELDYRLTDPQNGALNPLGVNCLRSFPVYSNICWGARTLEGADVQASEWKYIPVRRLTLFLEESLYRGTKWVVFEPNDEPLWAQIRLNVGAFMHTLFRQGAFQGTSPREAYLVKCDRETTTQNDIDSGIVNIVVGFAPLKPAEFVIIKIQQIAGDIQT